MRESLHLLVSVALLPCIRVNAITLRVDYPPSHAGQKFSGFNAFYTNTGKLVGGLTAELYHPSDESGCSEDPSIDGQVAWPFFAFKPGCMHPVPGAGRGAAD